MQEVTKNFKEVKGIINNLNVIGLSEKEEDKVDYALKRIGKGLEKKIKPINEKYSEKQELITEEIELKYVLTEKVGDKEKIVYDEVKINDKEVKRQFAYSPENLRKKNNELRKALKELNEEMDKEEVTFDVYFCDINSERLKNIDEDVKEELKGILFE